MALDLPAMRAILEAAAAEGRFSLLEHEVYAFLRSAGCQTPRFLFLEPGKVVAPERLESFGGKRVVLKIVSPHIAHKTEVGGVTLVENHPAAVARAAARMLAEVPDRFAALSSPSGMSGTNRPDLRGVLVVEHIPCDSEGPGSEVLVALRHVRELGPILTMGVGGIDTELLAGSFRPGAAVTSGSLAFCDERALLAAFRPTLAYRRLAGLTRANRKLVSDDEILSVIGAFRAVADAYGHDGSGEGWTLTELEVNPFGACRGRLVALDGLLRFRCRAPLPPPRPLASIERMLRPETLALVGASDRTMNFGRIILRNIIEAGFPRSRMAVIHEGCAEIEGVRCHAAVRDLPERVDVLVVAAHADRVPSLLEELVEHDKAVSAIVIPGGMAEKAGGEAIETRVIAAISKARALQRPLVVNGGNCLGVLSRPGGYHTLFIPQSKLPLRDSSRSNVALLSQSGAFMLSRMSTMAWLSPRYAISVGNQTDLTLGDFLRHLAGDPHVRTFGVYVEGFKDADGLDFARAVRDVVRSGRDVLFYKAGRTSEGRAAANGHTASIAGDYDVCAAVMEQAGALVAHTFEDFADLLKISSLLGDRDWGGRRLAALSNAGFETVGVSDSLRGERWQLDLAPLGDATRERLRKELQAGKLDMLVDVRNPLDLTPMADDRAHGEAVRAFLEDPAVDVVLCATVPLTPTLATLAEGVPEEQSIRSPGSLVNRLAAAFRETRKPLLASLDCGAPFDAMAAAIEEVGIPVFRSTDRATKAVGRYVESRRMRMSLA